MKDFVAQHWPLIMMMMMIFVQQIETFESKLSKMASQLDAQYELNKVADRKTKRAEADLLDMEQKLRQLECATHSSSDSDVLLEQQKVCLSLVRLSSSYFPCRQPPQSLACFSLLRLSCFFLLSISSSVMFGGVSFTFISARFS